MKSTFLHSLIVFFVLWIGCNVTTAQNQKIGYVNTDQILSQMSEYEGIQKKLSNLAAEWNKELEEMEQEIDRLQEDFEAKEILYTEELKKKKQQEIQNKVQERRQYLDRKFSSEGEYFQKQQELLEPIQRKVFKAINKVAADQNFDFVFDRAENSNMLFGNQRWNLNEDVLQELGITLNEPSN